MSANCSIATLLQRVGTGATVSTSGLVLRMRVGLSVDVILLSCVAL
jgi:hypothetical protein